MKTSQSIEIPATDEAIISDLNHLIGTNLYSLMDKKMQGHVQIFLFSSTHILQLVKGYLILRAAGDDYSARVLVRPMMESMFSAVACASDAMNVLKLGTAEYNEDKKLLDNLHSMISSINPKTAELINELQAVSLDLTSAKQGYDNFVQEFKHAFKYSIYKSDGGSSFDFANAIGLRNWYVLYRVYSQVVHGRIKYIRREMDAYFKGDNVVVMNICMIIIENLKYLPDVTIPDLEQYRSRVQRLSDLLHDVSLPLSSPSLDPGTEALPA